MSTQNGAHGPDDRLQAAGHQGGAEPADFSSPDVAGGRRTPELSAELTNPYQPPATLSNSPAALTEFERRNTMLLPEPDFWVVAFLSLGLLSLAILLIRGPGFLFLISTCGGIIRVCLIYYYRAIAGLNPLPANRLLLTSSAVTFALILCCVLAFGSVCSAGLILKFDHEHALVWLICCVVSAIALFIYMFKLSIGWALR